MAKSLVIVESPAKAKTINKYLGDNFKVMASMGHVRDLPANRLGVDVDDEFTPNYITMPSKRKVIAELKDQAEKAEVVYLAPDPDREGEAICWHLREAVIPKEKAVYRVMFNEITKKAIAQALEHPGSLDMKRVDAQQARRILDRLVGYKISPILWAKVKRGLSAGRVQSVALRMIVERDYEILNFNREEYWSFAADLEGSVKPAFQTKLVKWEGETIRQGNKPAKFTIETGEQADDIEAKLLSGEFLVEKIKRRAKKQSPPPAFTTPKLQQEAARSLGFTVHKTMMTAQRLYEGIEINGEPVGLITYMRTDSTRISEEALTQVRDYIGNNYKADYLPDSARVTKQKGNIQDSHEAIRPTNVEYTPENVVKFLNRDELRLYTLIWRRFVASQMNPKLMDETVFEITADQGVFEVKGLVTTFPGFTVLYTDGTTAQEGSEVGTAELPNINEGETLKLLKLEKKQNFTKPPSRYTEASLVKALEENGIGRPSTYASIIAVIQNRDYVEKRDGRFRPTELGLIVTALLVESFPELMDIKYTARMEDHLDQVEHGGLTWKALLEDFYAKFSGDLKQAETNMPDMKRNGLETDIPCEICGEKTVIKNGKYGQFLSCANYPDCTFAKKIRDIDPSSTKMLILKGMIGEESAEPQQLDIPCPKCDNALVRKRGPYGEFVACSNYPDCRYIHKEVIGVACPKPDCTGEVHVKKSKRGKVFYGCTEYPSCDFVSWDKPTGEACPDCNAPTLYEKLRKKDPVHYCANTECKFSRSIEEPAAAS